MEAGRGLRAPCAGRAPRKRRRASPLPGTVADPSSRAGVSQMCRRRLFASAGPRGPQPACLKKKFSGKNLPKIKEKVGYTDESSPCNQSSQVTARETTDFKIKEEESGESSVPLKESKIINFESKGSLKNAEGTSSTEITLPTGVSTFLIECLDEDSAADYSIANDSLKTYSSPETFRDGDLERCNFYSVDLGEYKNSTLLDSSKAVTIDKIPQISNLSAILEPVPEDFPDQCIRRKTLSNCYYSSSASSVSATLAGKNLCKITAARERTPDLKSAIRCSSPLAPESKHDNQAPKAKRSKKRASRFNPLEEGSSSLGQLDAPENTSARSKGFTAEVLPTTLTDAVVQMTSTMLIMEDNKVLNNPGNAQPLELDPLCDRQEICSIIRLSPGQRSSRLQQVPVKWKEFSLPKGVPEDTITSTKNWIYCKQR
ncbi:meiosis-specific kinetochore protein isoform X3 [Sylvia atricapilla]|uniref:meiosis-specific kinetochore protein isoform X3 n=1 Tax=Sylvia atricapilla TaxID=48155 RepID=UPI0033909991